jgi:microcystin-dependent protein
VQRPAPAHQPEPGALLAAGHHLRRRWRVNFALPDLRGRTPIHVGSGHTLGERGGEQAHTLSIAELPTHATWRSAQSATGTRLPAAASRRALGVERLSAPRTTWWRSRRDGRQHRRLQAHLNMQPFLTLSFCIALQGIFPSPN